MKRNIVLIGFMGTGKTTVGHALSARLGWPMVDTDERIVAREGRSIPELFRLHGEAYFRETEHQVLAEVLQGTNIVVSTGGGATLREDNRETMLSGGFVVALAAGPDTILARLRGDANRPLIAGDPEERVRKLMLERRDAYAFAHLAIDTSAFGPEEAVERIVAAVPWHERP